MKIGIYGGSFNPFHIGHEKICKHILAELELDTLIIVPVGKPSHRENNLEDSDIRFNIIAEIFKDNDKIFVSDIEISSKETSYTYDTLMKIKEEYGKKHEYFEIIGEDALENFEKWKNYKDILANAKLVVLKRRGYKGSLSHENIIYINNPYFNISATEIRNKIKRGEDISGLVNDRVKELIERELIDNV